jgi:pimeloyl-ACP methyl ester carboxylesterase
MEGVEAVLDALTPRQKVVLVGNSLGAWVAMLIAQRNPERVSLAVCVDGGAIRGSNLHARVLPRNRHEARESVEQTRDRRSPHVPDFVLDDIVRQAHQGSLARFAATEATMNHYLLDEAQLREIAVPVRLIWGTGPTAWSPWTMRPACTQHSHRRSWLCSTGAAMSHSSNAPQRSLLPCAMRWNWRRSEELRVKSEE